LQHGDINPNNIVIKFNEVESIDDLSQLFQIKLLDFLNIKSLGEIALQKVIKY